MPELPDLTIYVERIGALTLGSELSSARVLNPFLLRSVEPALEAFVGRKLVKLFLIGKRIIFDFGDEFFLLLHLMIAGRLDWKMLGSKTVARRTLAVLSFPTGELHLTEAGSKKRASLFAVQGKTALEDFDRGGIDPLSCDPAAFEEALTGENHTLKRCLTDPRLFSGIGNAYSDEILHAARLSPLKLSRTLTSEEVERLREACRETLELWIRRLREENGEAFPTKVTAFHEKMAVHGRFREPCRDCGKPIQRIRYASNECNYCAQCQNQGRILRDRSLSRLLKDDWPRNLDDFGERFGDMSPMRPS